MHAGFSPSKIILLNGLVNMSSLIGTVIGLSIGKLDESVN